MPTQPAVTPARSRKLDRVFAHVFDTLVYTQVWEDPRVDLEALALQPHHHLVGIASAGCNILAYLASGLARIDAVDINRAHLALSHLKLAALRHLPSYDLFFRFFGSGTGQANIAAYDAFIRPTLTAPVRSYWDRWSPWRGRRINLFSQDIHRHGLVGRFIGFEHFLARRGGIDPSCLINARDLDEQRALFQRHVAPIFDHPMAKRITNSPASLFALGCPPAQYQDLVEASDGSLIALLKERIRRLACDFPIADNYFAWQVFARRYDTIHRNAVPPYLQPDIYGVIRDCTERITLHNASLADYLATCPANSVHRFVLLDSQDWMTPDQISALWREITRTAHPSDARILFRTMGTQSRIVASVPPAICRHWVYQSADSERLHALDRSAIYGGLHLYIRNPDQPGA
jgi:S-adenosylmethionine-diacylglycerol 3-amino-3-carboxypropyl transferase